jgi:hypothetical protein
MASRLGKRTAALAAPIFAFRLSEFWHKQDVTMDSPR